MLEMFFFFFQKEILPISSIASSKTLPGRSRLPLRVQQVEKMQVTFFRAAPICLFITRSAWYSVHNSARVNQCYCSREHSRNIFANMPQSFSQTTYPSKSIEILFRYHDQINLHSTKRRFCEVDRASVFASQFKHYTKLYCRRVLVKSEYSF